MTVNSQIPASHSAVDVKEQFKAMLFRMQDEICRAVSDVDGVEFRTDVWERDEGHGGGRSRVLQDGNVFEKAGVNVSVVQGDLSPEAIKAMRAMGRLDSIVGSEQTFCAMGLSLVMHPRNPMAPTVHLNYRYFTVEDNEGHECWWFGGGADLTPSYVFEEDCIQFHNVLKQACDKHDPTYYQRFKKWCDEYFYITHRGEGRGIGGIFFDDLATRPSLAPAGLSDRAALVRFCTDCLETFPSTYCDIVKRRMNMNFTDAQKEWQQLRRGRYVEFNLIYDRGTKFGLNTPKNSRVESILMSLPLTARWEYCHEPAANSEEAKILDILKNPRNWLEV